MIKKYIKKFIFTDDIGIDNNTESFFMGVAGTGDLDTFYRGDIIDNNINNYTFTISNSNNIPQLTISNDGTINTNGRLQSLGNVIYNTNTNRLEFWDGVHWIEINT